MSITKLKSGETYFYVDSWTDDRDRPGTMVPTRVVEIKALTGGAKRPRAIDINREGRNGRYGFTIFFGSQYSDNAVWATREEAEAATVVNHALQKFYEENKA